MHTKVAIQVSEKKSFSLTLFDALCKFYVIEKGARSNCVLYMSFILGGGPDESWLHTCQACIITIWSVRLWASLVACS